MDEEYGVWGGLTRAERKRLRQTGRAPLDDVITVIIPTQQDDEPEMLQKVSTLH
jgi:hypothetical protein